ncbi:MAG: Asparagine synthetase [Nitrospira sp.]
MYVEQQVVLGHRRLSIIDLDTGKQPICNEVGTVWVVFNGEIYNFRQLREELLQAGHRFQTHTDTEVIVHLYEEYDVDFVAKLHGMFAIALWDKQGQTLVLARDRVGIKPLYYCVTDDSLIFASEIKAVLIDQSVSRSISFGAIDSLLRYHYIPGESTLFKNIKKLLPGHYLLYRNGAMKDVEYWDLRFPGMKTKKTETIVKQELIELLRKAVADHMISDVPVGFLLSGGVDSTALLSFAVEQTDKPISTFTIGFDSAKFADERQYAQIAADRFGTRHYDMTISSREFAEFLPQYVWHMEEPVCEPPAVALYYVTKLARSHVKVLLSGEGGDEAFAGYPDYRNLVWLERIKKALGPLSSEAGSLLLKVNRLVNSAKIEKGARLMDVKFEDYYFSRTSTPFSFLIRHNHELYTDSFRCALEKETTEQYRESLLERISDMELLDKMLCIDTKTWLPDDLLVKADKITMANSVELRVPLLDHAVLEYAASLPTDFKLRGFTTKYILKKAFEGRVPDQILYRKKTGFPVPYDEWMSKDIEGFVRDVLLSKSSINREYFSPKMVEQMLDANIKQPSYAKELFLLTAIELWHQMFVDNFLS